MVYLALMYPVIHKVTKCLYKNNIYLNKCRVVEVSRRKYSSKLWKLLIHIP